jgi:hypothetical protein
VRGMCVRPPGRDAIGCRGEERAAVGPGVSGAWSRAPTSSSPQLASLVGEDTRDRRKAENSDESERSATHEREQSPNDASYHKGRGHQPQHPDGCPRLTSPGHAPRDQPWVAFVQVRPALDPVLAELDADGRGEFPDACRREPAAEVLADPGVDPRDQALLVTVEEHEDVKREVGDRCTDGKIGPAPVSMDDGTEVTGPAPDAK